MTTSVAPRAFSPAACSAASSACGPPYSACHPSATVSSPRSTTAPTIGLGETRPHPRHASSSARRMAVSSRSLSLFKPHHRLAARADLSDEPRLHLRALGRAHGRLDVLARHDRDHPDAQIEYAPHLLASHLAGAHQHAEQGRPG